MQRAQRAWVNVSQGSISNRLRHTGIVDHDVRELVSGMIKISLLL